MLTPPSRTVQQDVDANELASDNAEAALQTELDDTQAGAGLGPNGAYTANAATNYIAAAMSLVGADEASMLRPRPTRMKSPLRITSTRRT